MVQWTDALTRLYDRDFVSDALAGFDETLKMHGGKLPPVTKDRPGLAWTDLPGLSCLIKHTGDLAQVGAHVGRVDPT
jgi:hypothetical protein